MSDGRPRVSIAIPAFRGAAYIGEALEAALAQTFPNREVLVVDDASDDDTVAVARAFEARGVRVHRNERRLGIAGNWNRCIELARGDVIALTHQDDRMGPAFIERAVAALDASPSAGLAHTAFRAIDAAGRPIRPVDRIVAAPPRAGVHEGLACAVRMIVDGSEICCPAAVARRGAFEACGAFAEGLRFALDLDMWLRIAERFDVVYLDEPLFDYRVHPTQQTRAEGRIVRTLEDIEVRLAAYRRLARAGRLSPDADAACRRGLARDCVKAALRCFLPRPRDARAQIANAVRLRGPRLPATLAAAAPIWAGRAVRRAVGRLRGRPLGPAGGA